MDIKVVGNYLAELRKENNMTQEQLGDKLGVTNKTISRWETGTYLPPVDILEQLSKMYGITINEIISGRTLTDMEYKEAAEQNIKSVLNKSTFTLQDKIEFFKKKWKKENMFIYVLGYVVIVCLIVAGFFFDNGLQILGAILAIVWPVIQYNKMMSYVEQFAYDGRGSE